MRCKPPLLKRPLLLRGCGDFRFAGKHTAGGRQRRFNTGPNQNLIAGGILLFKCFGACRGLTIAMRSSLGTLPLRQADRGERCADTWTLGGAFQSTGVLDQWSIYLLCE